MNYFKLSMIADGESLNLKVNQEVEDVSINGLFKYEC